MHPMLPPSFLLIALQGLFTVLVFVMDILSPRGVAVEMLYVLLVLSGILMPRSQQSLVLAAISTLLVIVGFFFSPLGAPLWMGVTNRSMTLFAIWATAVLVFLLKRSERVLRSTDSQLEASLRGRGGKPFPITRESSAEPRDDVRPQEAYRDLLEGIPAVVYTAEPDGDGAALYVSPQIETLLGYSPVEWLAEPSLWVNRLHPDDRDRVLTEYARAVSNKELFLCRYRLRAKDGRTVWVEAQATVVLDKHERPVCVQGIMLDISSVKGPEPPVVRRTAPTKGLRIAYLAFIELDVANACLVHTREISEQWVMAGHDVTAILPRPLHGQAWGGIHHAWVHWWGFERWGQLAFFIDSAWQLIWRHRRQPFDALYVRELLRHPFLPWLMRRLKLPYFIEVNGWALDDLRLQGASEAALRVMWRDQQKLLAGAAGIVVSTAGNARKVIRYYGIPDQRVFVQELGTNAQLFAPGNKGMARRRFGLPMEAPIIVFAGSFHPHHDLSTMVKAFASLGEGEQRPWLLLLGYGTTWDAVRKQCESLGIADRVLLPGSRPYEEVPLYFQAADLAVLPLSRANVRQRNGCITLKLWDYMATGLPVLVTDLPDTPSAALLRDKAYIVQPEDPKAMAAAMRDLITRDDLRARIGAAGLDYVRKHRTWQHAAEETIQFMRSRLAEVSEHGQ